MRGVLGRECGTLSGYTGGCRCDGCRAANTEYQREWRARNPRYLHHWRKGTHRRMRIRGAIPDIVLDHLETLGPLTMDTLVATITERHGDLEAQSIRRAVWRLASQGLVLHDAPRFRFVSWGDRLGVPE